MRRAQQALFSNSPPHQHQHLQQPWQPCSSSLAARLGSPGVGVSPLRPLAKASATCSCSYHPQLQLPVCSAAPWEQQWRWWRCVAQVHTAPNCPLSSLSLAALRPPRPRAPCPPWRRAVAACRCVSCRAGLVLCGNGASPRLAGGPLWSCIRRQHWSRHHAAATARAPGGGVVGGRDGRAGRQGRAAPRRAMRPSRSSPPVRQHTQLARHAAMGLCWFQALERTVAHARSPPSMLAWASRGKSGIRVAGTLPYVRQPQQGVQQGQEQEQQQRQRQRQRQRQAAPQPTLSAKGAGGGTGGQAGAAHATAHAHAPPVRRYTCR